jgi:1,5-anhydro-D-fructose reductase (1,5-anhydro-D-mannitol-forming)
MLKDDELDAVIIASPDGLHASQAIAAAEAGKHVFVEKPMATELDDAKRMIDAAVANDVQLGVAYHLRWHAGHRALVERIRRGDLGRLRHVRALWTWKASDDSNWRARKDVGRWWGLGGVGTHCLDLVRWILLPTAGEVVDISSTVTQKVYGGPHDETAILSLRFESGATAEICSSVLFESPTRLEVYGAKSWAIAEDTLGAHGAGTIRLGREMKVCATSTCSCVRSGVRRLSGFAPSPAR